ncbi:MAG TPA: hypothetical protein VLB12_03500 [Gemmatimonadales bacterium]|nr:hypothetical protein [Gemmatimonadales bacterium]
MREKPPLRPEEVRRILRELAPLSEDRRIILVGGQAVAFWAAFFKLKPRSAEQEIFTSKDIDFEGAARAARRAGELLDGEVRIPTIDDHTPNTGIVLFEDSDGEAREIDFLVAPYGLDGRDVRDTAVKLAVTNPTGPDLPVWVMHPERCMESRIYNVIDLRQRGRIGLDQLRRSVVCAREFSRFLLDNDGVAEAERVRAVLRLNERIYRKCLKDRAFRRVVFDHDVDPFDAVLVDDRLPERFREKRYPQMVEQIADRRRRSRAQRERVNHRKASK